MSKVVVKLVVDPLSTGSAPPANIAIAAQSEEKSGQHILAAYDVSLFKSVYDASGSLVSDGKVSNSNINAPIIIQIPIPSQYGGRTDLQMVYIDDSGNITPLATTIVTENGVKYLQFTTTHFSVYAIVIKNSATSPDTGDSGLPIGPALPICLIVFSGVAVISIRTKKENVAHVKLAYCGYSSPQNVFR